MQLAIVYPNKRVQKYRHKRAESVQRYDYTYNIGTKWNFFEQAVLKIGWQHP